MPRYPDYVLREVAEKNDIIEVVSQSVELKKAGSSYIGLCPFHNEKTPSFSVSPRRAIFKCFGCGEGGDVINFVMKKEGISFYEAVKNLAQRANIMLPEIKSDDNEKVQKSKEQRELIYEINKEAASFFYSNVKSSDESISYFKQRGITSEIVKTFWLGYSQNGWTSLFDHLKQKGYKEDDIFEAGLIRRHESGRYYDYFRNRIMFTIFDANSNVIGFGGRVLDDSKPKYLNSPDSKVFSKGKNLYGLNIARNSKKRFCILTEGYMDAIALIKSGYDNTLATLGTAIGDYQAKTISKYFDEVVICYDSDDAGRNATLRAISVLRKEKIKITVLNLKSKKDPDEFIKSFGVERFNSLLEQRKPDMEYLIDYFGQQYNLNKSDEVILYISKLCEYLKLIEREVELDVYVNIISQKTNVQPSSILSQVGIEKKTKPTYSTNADVINVISKGIKISNDNDYLEKTRSLLLGTIFYEQNLFNKYKSHISEDMFSSSLHKKIYNHISDCLKKGEKPTNTSVISLFETSEEINEVSGILALDIQIEDSEKAVIDYIKQINEKSTMQRAISMLNNNEITLEEFNEMIKKH